jgi:hypothetical protein
MTARLYKFPPPRSAGLYDPLRNGAEPQDYLPADLIRRRVADEHPDLIEALRKAGYVRDWRDDLDDYLADVRCATAHHATSAIFGAFIALMLVVAPFLLGLFS